MEAAAETPPQAPRAQEDASSVLPYPSDGAVPENIATLTGAAHTDAVLGNATPSMPVTLGEEAVHGNDEPASILLASAGTVGEPLQHASSVAPSPVQALAIVVTPPRPVVEDKSNAPATADAVAATGGAEQPAAAAAASESGGPGAVEASGESPVVLEAPVTPDIPIATGAPPLALDGADTAKSTVTAEGASSEADEYESGPPRAAEGDTPEAVVAVGAQETAAEALPLVPVAVAAPVGGGQDSAPSLAEAPPLQKVAQHPAVEAGAASDLTPSFAAAASAPAAAGGSAPRSIAQRPGPPTSDGAAGIQLPPVGRGSAASSPLPPMAMARSGTGSPAAQGATSSGSGGAPAASATITAPKIRSKSPAAELAAKLPAAVLFGSSTAPAGSIIPPIKHEKGGVAGGLQGGGKTGKLPLPLSSTAPLLGAAAFGGDSKTSLLAPPSTRSVSSVDMEKAAEAMAKRISSLPPSRKKQLQRIADNPLNVSPSAARRASANSGGSVPPRSSSVTAVPTGGLQLPPVSLLASATRAYGPPVPARRTSAAAQLRGGAAAASSDVVNWAVAGPLPPVGGPSQTRLAPITAPATGAGATTAAGVAARMGVEVAPDASAPAPGSSGKLFDPFNPRNYLTGSLTTWKQTRPAAAQQPQQTHQMLQQESVLHVLGAGGAASTLSAGQQAAAGRRAYMSGGAGAPVRPAPVPGDLDPLSEASWALGMTVSSSALGPPPPQGGVGPKGRSLSPGAAPRFGASSPLSAAAHGTHARSVYAVGGDPATAAEFGSQHHALSVMGGASGAWGSGPTRRGPAPSADKYGREAGWDASFAHAHTLSPIPGRAAGSGTTKSGVTRASAANAKAHLPPSPQPNPVSSGSAPVEGGSGGALAPGSGSAAVQLLASFDPAAAAARAAAAAHEAVLKSFASAAGTTPSGGTAPGSGTPSTAWVPTPSSGAAGFDFSKYLANVSPGLASAITEIMKNRGSPPLLPSPRTVATGPQAAVVAVVAQQAAPGGVIVSGARAETDAGAAAAQGDAPLPALPAARASGETGEAALEEEGAPLQQAAGEQLPTAPKETDAGAVLPQGPEPPEPVAWAAAPQAPDNSEQQQQQVASAGAQARHRSPSPTNALFGEEVGTRSKPALSKAAPAAATGSNNATATVPTRRGSNTPQHASPLAPVALAVVVAPAAGEAAAAAPIPALGVPPRTRRRSTLTTSPFAAPSVLGGSRPGVRPQSGAKHGGAPGHGSPSRAHGSAQQPLKLPSALANSPYLRPPFHLRPLGPADKAVAAVAAAALAAANAAATAAALAAAAQTAPPPHSTTAATLAAAYSASLAAAASPVAPGSPSGNAGASGVRFGAAPFGNLQPQGSLSTPHGGALDPKNTSAGATPPPGAEFSPNEFAAAEARRGLLARIYRVSISSQGGSGGRVTPIAAAAAAAAAASGSDQQQTPGAGSPASAQGAAGTVSQFDSLVTVVNGGPGAPESRFAGDISARLFVHGFGTAGPFAASGAHAAPSGGLGDVETQLGGVPASPQSSTGREAEEGEEGGHPHLSPSPDTPAPGAPPFQVPSILVATAHSSLSTGAPSGGAPTADTVRRTGTVGSTARTGTAGPSDPQADAAAATYVRSAAAAAEATDADAYVDAIVTAEAAAEVVFRTVAQGGMVRVVDEGEAEAIGRTPSTTGGSIGSSITSTGSGDSSGKAAGDLEAGGEGHPSRRPSTPLLLRGVHGSGAGGTLSHTDLPSPDLTPTETETIRQEARRRAAAKLGVTVAMPDAPQPQELDGDLLQAHHDALWAFATAHAPSMLQSLPAAWAKYGATPLRLWGVIQERYPDATAQFCDPISVEAEKRGGLRKLVEAAGDRAVARAQAARKQLVQAAERRIAGRRAAGDSSSSEGEGEGEAGGSVSPASSTEGGSGEAATVSGRMEGSADAASEAAGKTPPDKPVAASVAPPAPAVDRRPVPATDDDLAAWHYERLVQFAHDIAPSMTTTIPEAWARFGSTPLRIWSAIDKRFPGANVPYVADLVAIAEERARRREGGDPTPGGRVFPTAPPPEEEPEQPKKQKEEEQASSSGAASAAAAPVSVGGGPGSERRAVEDDARTLKPASYRAGLSASSLSASAGEGEGEEDAAPASLSTEMEAALAPFAPPPNDDDLLPLYKERLMLYAAEVAPEIGEHIESAFDRFADRPLLLFASCERKYPNTTNEYVEDLVAAAEIRKLAREIWHLATGPERQPVHLCELVELLRQCDPDLSAIPEDDSDILQVHFTRMAAFAEAHAPSMLASLNSAFARHAERPETLWRAIERRFPPSTCEPYFLDVLALQHARVEGRQKLAALLAAAGVTEAQVARYREGDSAEEAESQRDEPEAGDDEEAVTAPAAPAPRAAEATAKGEAQAGTTAATAAAEAVASGATAAAEEADSGSTAATPPVEAAVGAVADGAAEVPSAPLQQDQPAPAPSDDGGEGPGEQLSGTGPVAPGSSSSLPPAEAGVVDDGGQVAALPPAEAEVVAPTWMEMLADPGVQASLQSSYVEPPGIIVMRDGTVLPGEEGAAGGEALPPGSTVVRMTRDVPALPSLEESLQLLQSLSPVEWELLRAVKEPHPALLVAFSVLCVLSGSPTSWQSALGVVADPLLVSKLQELSVLGLEQTPAEGGALAGAAAEAGLEGDAAISSAAGEGGSADSSSQGDGTLTIAIGAGPGGEAGELDGGPRPETAGLTLPATLLAHRRLAIAAAAAATAPAAASATLTDATETSTTTTLGGVRENQRRRSSSPTADGGAGPTDKDGDAKTNAQPNEKSGNDDQTITEPPATAEETQTQAAAGLTGGLTPRIVTLCRRLLNKRPDIRAEVRCLSAALDAPTAPGLLVAAPLAALVAIVEWEVALVLRASSLQKKASKSDQQQRQASA